MLTQKDAFLSKNFFYPLSTEYAVDLELERFITDMSLFERYLFTSDGMWRVKKLHTYPLLLANDYMMKDNHLYKKELTRLYQMYLNALSNYDLKEEEMTECLDHYNAHCSKKYCAPIRL